MPTLETHATPHRSLASILLLMLASIASAAEPDTKPAKPAANPDKPAAKKKHPANRLAKETSPYLLLHAHNPVDWRPWGPEAFEQAAKEKKLIFLSIGYSSCYWCHVMERESFMDEGIAKKLNDNFICIKVDREERPDVDEIYMTALQVLSQRGGWPLSMFLMPDGRPLVGGTYFPPKAKEGIDGFPEILDRVQGFWSKDPKACEQQADAVTSATQRTLRPKLQLAAKVPADAIKNAVAAIADEYDAQYGGFGFVPTQSKRPKFPRPAVLTLLLNRAEHDDTASKNMLFATLDKMARGGIYDHLGGGFHRYSTDRMWRIPHFEKMLYDNALLASVYAEAYRMTKKPELKQVVEETLAFVRREMTSPEGGFYSALDAETDADEGSYYVWTEKQLKSLLSEDEYELFANAYGLAEGPNFEDDRHVLYLVDSPEKIAEDKKIKKTALLETLSKARAKLLKVRNTRKRPLTDTKILAGWNGLMIRGFADAGRCLESPEHTATAAKAAELVLAKLRTPEGRLLRTYTAGQAKLNAYLDDYAYLLAGLTALHKATGDNRWLEESDRLADTLLKLFWDEQSGGFFYTSSDHEKLLARSKDPTDSATPSPNAVAAESLLYLASAIKKSAEKSDDRKSAAADLERAAKYRSRAEKTTAAFAQYFTESAGGMSWMALVLAELGETPRDDK